MKFSRYFETLQHFDISGYCPRFMTLKRTNFALWRASVICKLVVYYKFTERESSLNLQPHLLHLFYTLDIIDVEYVTQKKSQSIFGRLRHWKEYTVCQYIQIRRGKKRGFICFIFTFLA